MVGLLGKAGVDRAATVDGERSAVVAFFSFLKVELVCQMS
jgi:hypothetical protein